MGKSYKKSARSAANKNKQLNEIVLTEDDAVFGRITKKLGFGRCKIQVPDDKKHIIDVEAYTLGKNNVRMDIGDVVIVGCNASGKSKTYEILGCCDRKIVETLRQSQRLHPGLFSEEDILGDDIFDRSEEVKGEEETTIKKDKFNKPVKKEKNLLDPNDDDDVNVDDI